MGNKIFVSYKYWDSNVKFLNGYSKGTPKVRDYVSWIEDKFTNRSNHIYKGEHDNEDLSDKSEDYIWSKLKDKIYDSTVTIVLISPNMKEQSRWEKSQWIPWEISYSLRETLRNGFVSRSNAILAVVLPDRVGSYLYYESLRKFRILESNILNGYIPVIDWDHFKYNCDYYINKALKAKEFVPSYKVVKSI